MTSSFRVLTYNIHKGFSHGNLKFVLRLLKERLLETHADIVCLQEVAGEFKRKSVLSAESQFEYLADSVWPHYAYGKNAVYTGGDHGNAILSKYPIRSYENLDISTNRFERRGLLHACIDFSEVGREVEVFNTHLNLREKDRQAQVAMVGGKLASCARAERPILFAGDFNDWQQKISGRLSREFGFEEAFKSSQGSYAKTYPSLLPILRLDRIHFKGLKLAGAHKLSGHPWSRLSDHLALMADFQFQ